MTRVVTALSVLLLVVLACGNSEPRELHLYPTDTPVPTVTPPPSPTVTPTEAPMIDRTPVPTKQMFGVVIVETLERRTGPGESFSALSVPLKAGDVVTVYDCIHDGGDVWYRIGEGVWAAARYEGRELIHGGCR